MSGVRFEQGLRERLAANLARLAPAPLEPKALKRAAVCVIVTGRGGEAALLVGRIAGVGEIGEDRAAETPMGVSLGAGVFGIAEPDGVEGVDGAGDLHPRPRN